ncbi:uncharacterized protein LOC116412907 [Galleria mellonella]|uniref:Uncharacterized protein LOC116412907 n=1 Tax=Galleria mellonella TaxID=7137 RepID=A0ABM3N013_GALME|nr:uncharacterized protein LOC116412907 [Galleria mellonella]
MNGQIFWIFVVLCSLLLPTCKGMETQYECGPHGRFEYCIDGIPGCVVGCHCHPGYYFDTETKVCEPNVKLTQNFRRLYMSEPTRIPSQFTTVNAIDATPTTNKALNDNVDAITKDADDLGDWLYNQFFKTIENQVINKSDNESMTRRSGSDPPNRVSKRKIRKFGKKSKRKKFSKKGLRKKLLRITEDDSLFHSSSSSDDSSSSSSYSDSSSYERDNDDEHDHRKIIMINKKPTPPLPSFIFLPNIDTPFYPPIGLPPPPIIPMYPMVPVPPMSPKYPAIPKPENEKTTTTKQTKHNESVIITPTEATPNKIEPTNPPPSEKPPPENVKRSKKEKIDRRNEFLKQIREKIKRHKMPPNYFGDQYEEPNLHSLDDNFPLEPFSYNEIKPKADETPKIEDVDFKYLTQLIHRVDLNKTKNKNFAYKTPTENMLEFYSPVPNFRRNNLNTYKTPITNQFYPKVDLEHRRYLPKTDDSYYTSLGREIASLIRKIDTKGEREINIEIEQENQNNQKPSAFNENRYAPRSYWERSIRSLLINLDPNANKSGYSRDSNEKLFNLENQVVAATTKPSLNLQELENIVNIIERTQSQEKNYKTKNNKTPSSNINSNVFPKGIRRSNTIIRYVTKPKADYINDTRIISTISHHGTSNVSNVKDRILRTNVKNETKNQFTPSKDINKINLSTLHNILQKQHLSPMHHDSKKIQNNIKYSYQLDPLILNPPTIEFESTLSTRKYDYDLSAQQIDVTHKSKFTDSNFRHLRNNVETLERSMNL